MTSSIVSEAKGIIAALICPRLQHVKLLSSDLGGKGRSRRGVDFRSEMAAAPWLWPTARAPAAATGAQPPPALGSRREVVEHTELLS
jgi:hypothetical protein